MSENARKDCRTQGKYSDRNQYYEDRRPQKRQDKRQKGSPSVKEPQEKKFHKRKSDGGKASSTSLSSECESPVRYEENSVHSFSQLEDVRKPVEIKTPGKHTLSITENGESVVLYNPDFFDQDEADELMHRLYSTTNWHEKNIIIHGVEYPQPRLVAWYGPFPYSYSGATLESAEMPDCILQIKGKVEECLKQNGINVILNSVLLNLYRDNKDSVAWHSDDEMSMGVCPTIASVSLGETRKFEMRRKLKQPIDESSLVKHEEYFVHVTHGSLLIMDGCMQKDWQHRVPKEYHDKYERINLTFRTVYKLEDLTTSPGINSKNQPTDSVLKKSHQSRTDYDVKDYVEDFPPLNSDTSPVCSGTVKKSPEPSASMEIKIGDYNRSQKRGSSGSSSYNKTPLKNSNEVTESDDMWDAEPSPSNTSLKNSNEITESDGTWDAEQSPCSNTSLKNSNGITESDDMWGTEPSPRSNTSSKNSNEITEADMWNAEPPPSSNTLLKTDDMWNAEQPPSSNTLLKTNNKIRRSDLIWGREFTHNKSSLKSRDKISGSQNVCGNESSYKKASLKTNDKINGSGFWDSEPSSCNGNFLKTDAIINDSEKHTIEPSCNKKSTILNNLNDDKKNAKIDMQNKNLHAYDSNFSSNNVNTTANVRRNKNLNKKESHYAPTNSSVNNMQENAHRVKKEPTSGKDGKWTPNVEAKEFVPGFKCTALSENNLYSSFGLENLLNYNVDLMDYDSLRDYSYALKNRVLEKIHEFYRSYQEELDVLCKLTDGNQTEKNQKIITARMSTIVERALEHLTSPNFRKTQGNPRKLNLGNQNHFSGRKYQSGSRENHHRY